jgi:hypothetical protein
MHLTYGAGVGLANNTAGIFQERLIRMYAQYGIEEVMC